MKLKHWVEQSQQNHKKTKLKPLEFINLKVFGQKLSSCIYSPHLPCFRARVKAGHMAIQNKDIISLQLWCLHVTKLCLMEYKQKCHVTASRNLPYKTAGSWTSSSFSPPRCWNMNTMSGALATILDYDNSADPFRKWQSSELEGAWKKMKAFLSLTLSLCRRNKACLSHC